MGGKRISELKTWITQEQQNKDSGKTKTSLEIVCFLLFSATEKCSFSLHAKDVMQIDGNFSAKHHGVLDLSFFISALVRYNVWTVILPQMSHVSSFLWAPTNFLSASAFNLWLLVKATWLYFGYVPLINLRGSTVNPCQVGFPGVEKTFSFTSIRKRKHLKWI